MRAIAVLGLSTFGRALVRALAGQRCRVLAVDREEAAIDSIREIADEAVIADVRDRRALEALRLQDFDAVVLSLGEPIDASLLAALHLRDLGVRNVIAKAVTLDHRRLLNQLGATEVIFPEYDTAERTARTLSKVGFLDTVRLGDDVSIVEMAPTHEMIGHSLAELELRQRFGITVIAVREALGDRVRVTPDPHDKITDSQALIVLGRDEDLDRLVRK
jgi:trk system potassium uptake protein TrkA